MISNRAAIALLLVAALVAVASPAAAQYMYLDANGNGLHDPGDRLAANGSPTTVNVWVVTDHNRDGSPVVCPQDAGAAMDIISYVVNLQASLGTVSYSGFSNLFGTVPFGEFNPADGIHYKNGFGGIVPGSPGTYRLCALTVTGLTGTPQIDIVDRIDGSGTTNGGAEWTSFGSSCFGNDFDNTLKLAGPAGGTDWTDVDGLGPAVIDEAIPSIAPIGNKTVSEGNCLTFTVTATPAHGGALVFTLDPGAPIGASITTDGQFSWCPTEAQGPGVYSITVRVTEDGTPPTSDVETFQVTVAEVNQPPVLDPIGNKTIMAGNTLSFTATATDPDLPAPTLTFSLDPGAPAGATITLGGLFSWPVPVNQVAGVTITARVSDGFLSDAKSFAVTVLIHETGSPVVTNPGDKTVNEGACLNVPIAATGGQGTLTFTLGAGAPAGASITALGGQFNWCPTEAQGPGQYAITVNCSDGVSVGSTTFNITVLEVNQAPVLNPIGNMVACGPGTAVTFTATATDADIPSNLLTFSLDPGAAPGATIGAVSGVFSWNPQSPGSFPFTIRVTDNGSPPLSDSETITITVAASNQPPVLDQPADMTVTAGLTADQLLHATDACEATTLTFSKVSGPAFVTVGTNGNVHVAPGSADVGTHSVTVAVSDDGTPVLVDQKTFTVTVTPNSAQPVLQQPANMTVDEGVVADQTLIGSDPDNAPLTFTKTSGPLFMTVTTAGPTTGNVRLEPGFADAGSYTGAVRASNGTLFDQKSFTITVTNVCRTPTASAGGPYSGAVNIPLAFHGTGSSDPDGGTLSYLWDFGDASSGSGSDPSHTYQAAGTYTVTLRVTNPCGLFDDDVTTATIGSGCAVALAFTSGGNKSVNLGSGKPSTCVQIQPLADAFAIESVDLTSIVMQSDGTGSVAEIHALGTKTSLSSDRNNDGVDEIAACFRKEDLQQLFSSISGTQQREVILRGDILGGGSFCTSLTLTIKAGGGGNLAVSITPNPLNPSAVLTFHTEGRGRVLVQLFDVRGRLLRTLQDENDAAAGYHDVRIDGVNANGARLSSGVYFVRIRAGADEERKAITILK
ncbi:MAG TPA: putative Ig domain-containing protein [Candidatus Eisenbacteria bacterium]|nr:putative Ig domain-containing protein [Candidatus Eisenbacteria bacterium]